MIIEKERPTHIQFFTFKSIIRLLEKCGFKVKSKRHSDFLSFLPSMAVRKLSKRGVKYFSKILTSFDLKLADYLPPQMASGWYFSCDKIEY